MKPKIFITFAPLKHSATSCCGKNCLSDFRFNHINHISQGKLAQVASYNNCNCALMPFNKSKF